MLSAIILYLLSILLWIYIIEYFIKPSENENLFEFVILGFIGYIVLATLLFSLASLPANKDPKLSDHTIEVENEQP